MSKDYKRRNCYFYAQYNDMGASTPICSFFHSLADAVNAECEGCQRYIDKTELDYAVRKIVEEGDILIRMKKGETNC